MQNSERITRSISSSIKRSDFVGTINQIINSKAPKGKNVKKGKGPSCSSSSSNSSPKIPKNLSPRSKIKFFNRKISQELDPELKDYVRDFRKKVEVKYQESKINHQYLFPRTKEPNGDSGNFYSENDENELEGVTYYDLKTQNCDKHLDTVDQLVELITKLGKRDKNELRIFIGQVFIFFYKCRFLLGSKKIH